MFGEMIQFDEHIFQVGGSTTNQKGSESLSYTFLFLQQNQMHLTSYGVSHGLEMGYNLGGFQASFFKIMFHLAQRDPEWLWFEGRYHQSPKHILE